MKSITDFFKYMKLSFILDVKRTIAYPISFWFTFFTIPFFSLVQIVFIETIYSQTNSFVGYSKYEAYILFGTFRLVQGLGFLIFYNRLSELKSLIRGDDEETFDYASPQKLDNLLRYKNAGKNNQESTFNSL